MEPSTPQNPNLESEAIERASRQLFKGDGLDFAHLARPADNSQSDVVDSSQLTNDEIYDFIQENRDRTFDHTTEEGRMLYLRFKEANSRRNEFSLNAFKEMAKRVAAVPADIVKGVFNNPLKAPASLADGMARDALDLYGVLAQSEDPSSPLFRFRNYIFGNGSIEDQIKQFNEARWWNNRSNELEEGKDTVIEHWVPDNYREFARSLIDPKLANALSYIGLDAPQVIKGAFKRGGIRASAEILKGGLADHHVLNAQRAAETANWFETSASKFRELSQRLTGETLQATASVASAPFEFIREKILRGSQEIESKLGYVPPEVSNGASTLMADMGSAVTKGGVEISPIKSILFSLGVKPIAEYASVVGSELVDAANGVVKVRPEHTGLGLMNRLALNGGRISLSGEAQAVAKFANVVVGWPASMAFPAFKRAVGDAAYMGALGYANARGEGAASGIGMGFAWGGFSGGLRHIHNVYNQSVAHDYVISNFDKGQILEIEKKSPEHAQNIRELLTNIDASGDKRVMATVRAEIMAGWVSDYETQLRYKDVPSLVSEYGEAAIKNALGGDLEVAATRRGGSFAIDGKNIIWVNRNAPPEALGHEFGHRFLDILLSKTDGSAVEAVQSFIGDDTDKGVVPDDVLAMFIGHYSMVLAGYDSKWLNSPTPSFIPTSAKNPNKKGGGFDLAYGNIAYAKEQIRKFRELVKSDPNAIRRFTYVDNVPRMEIFDQFPIIEKLMHETFAYSHSNNMLVRSPDFFLRNPNMKSIRHVMENWQMLNNQRLVSNLEAAGYVLRESKNENGETVLQGLFWDDGKFLSLPLLDKWGEDVMRRVLRQTDVHVSTMSPDRAEAFAKQTYKQRFLSGGRFKTKKEVEETITATADSIAATLDALPDNIKPKWSIERGGSRKVKLTELSKEAWDAIEASNVYHPEEFKVLVGMVDVLKQIEAGKPVFNTFTAQYLGWSKQITEAALGERLKGRQVPVTFRHFAPFDIELTVSKFDEFGNPLANPRSHITIHAHDVNVLNRRKMNQWQKPEVRSLFRDFGHFSETFVSWFSQLSEDPSTRKPSADYLRPEFGKNAERVRDVMYETWGGRKRNDETYINIPEGYAGGKDGPDYPIHSLRFDLLANVLKQSQIFPEAFQGQVMGLYHRHGIAYEPMRRNMMLGNFVQRELTNGRRFYTDANGFEIRGEIPKLKLFNMYGNLVGIYKTMESAQKAATRALKKLPVEELMPTKSDMGDSMSVDEPVLEYDHGAVGAISGASNLMIANGRRVRVAVDHTSPKVKAFSIEAQEYMQDFRHGIKSSRVEDMPKIKLVDLLKTPKDVIDAFPELVNFSVTVNPYAADHGGTVVGIGGGSQMGTIAQITPDSIATEGDAVTFGTELAAGLQELSALKEGFVHALRVPYVASDLRLTPELKVHQKVGDFIDEATLLLGNKPSPKEFKEFLRNKVEAYVGKVVENWVGIKPYKYPQWVDTSKTFKDSSDVRFSSIAWDILYEFAGYNIPPEIARDFNDHWCNVAEKIKDGEAFVVQIVDGGVIIADGDLFKLPESVEKYFNQTHMDMRTNPPTPEPMYFWKRYNEQIKELALTHFVSKDGDRKQMGTQREMEIIRRENVSASSFTVDPQVIETFGGLPFKFTSHHPDVPRQASNIFDAVSDKKTFILHVDAGLSRSDDSSDVRTFATFNTLSLMRSGGEGGKFGNKPYLNTTTPMLAHNHPLRGMLGGNNPVFDLSTEMALTRTSPFVANGKKGELHKLYETGWHIGVLSKLSAQLGIPFDSSKDATYVGLSRYVKSLSASGVDTPEKLVALRMARGSLLAEQARHILSGDSDGLHRRFVRSEPKFNSRYSPMDYAMVLANRGYALMSHALASATLGQTRRKGNKRNRFGSSILESSFADPEQAPKLSAKFLKIVFDSIDALEANGYRPAKMKRGETNVGVSHTMLGGFSNSTAKEREMLETGALRLVRTDSGKTYKAFEFSDKDAVLLLEKVGGKMHLLPFMEDGDKGFETFLRNTELGLNAVFMDANSVKLGDILDHKLLYLHYPSLRNVSVQWKEGYGADYNPDSDVIRLGIDTFIGEELASRRNKDYLTHALFGHDGQRHATETLLHEIQHAIQMREMWSDSYALTGGTFGTAGRIMAANIAGVAGRTISAAGENKDINNQGVEFYTADGQKATFFSNEETLNSIYRLGNTPMHKHLRQIAYPAFVRVSNEAINALTDAHIHHPPEHPARRNAQSAVKSLVVMREEARALTDKFKNGELSEQAFRDLMCDTDNGLAIRFIRRIEQVRNAMYLDASPVAEKLYNAMGNAEKYLHRSLEALNGFEFISKMAEKDGLNGDVVLASTKLKQIFNSLAGMHYLSQRIEVEANLTEQRSRMTQAELNSTGLNPDGSRKSLLDGMTGALDIGYKGNTLRNIGIALKNKQRVRVADLMLGGVASKDPSRNTSNMDILSMMARASLITWTVRQLKNELDSLDRVAVIGRGWEVAEDGSVKLVAKTATVQLGTKGPRKNINAMADDLAASIPNAGNVLYSMDDNDRVHVTNAIWGSGERTVTIEDIARIIDGIVLNEWEVRTPTEAMDAVLRDDFPAVVKVSDIRNVLIERGVSDDGIAMANIEAFFKDGNGKSNLYGSIELTKYELADLMAVVHRQYINERIVSVSEGVKKFGEVKLNRDNISPESVIEAITQVNSNEGNTTDPLRSFMLQKVGAVFDLADSDVSTIPFQEGKPRIGISNLDANERIRRVQASITVGWKPEWMSDDDYNAIIERLAKKGLLNTGSLFRAVGVRDSEQLNMAGIAAENLVRETNRRIRRKMFLIKPFYEKMVGIIDASEDSVSRKIKIRLLDEMTKVLIEPELEGMREFNGQNSIVNTQNVIPYTQTSDVTNQDFAKSPSARFGMTLSIVGSGNSMWGDTGFIELQTLQTAVGPTDPLSKEDLTFKLRSEGTPTNIYDVRTWDDSTIRHIYRDNRVTQSSGSFRSFEHLNAITTATKNLVESTREMLAYAEQSIGEGRDDANLLNKLRLLNDISTRLLQVEERSTALIGDNKESNSDQPSRNVITGQSYLDGMASRIAQESFLIKGYSGNDGSVVLGETKVANTVSAVQLDGVTSMPFFDGSGLPSVVATPQYVVNAVSGLVARDMAVRTVLFGSIKHGNATQGPLSYISPISDFVEGLRTPTNPSVIVSLVNPNESSTVVNTINGNHALHSCLYTATARYGHNAHINGALGADVDFYKAWGMGWMNLRKGVDAVDAVSAASYVPALAPLIAAALSPKQIGVRKGRITVVDHLSAEQRQLLKNARDAYKDFSMDTGASPTPEQKAAFDAFFDTISEEQHRLMFGHLDTANAEITFTALCGAYEAMSMIDRLPASPTLDNLFGRSMKEVLKEEIGHYISEGRYMYEQGNAEGPVAKTKYAGGNSSAKLMHALYKNTTQVETGRHMLFAVWSLMDQHAQGYRAQMHIEMGSGQNYPMYFRNGHKGNLLNSPFAAGPYADMRTHYAKRQFANVGPELMRSDFDNASATGPSFFHSLSSNETLPSGDDWNEHYILQATDVGLAESLFMPIDPSQTSSNFAVIDDGIPQQAQDQIVGAPRIDVSMRGSPISNKLSRKQMVDSIIMQAKRNKTDAISLEPARMRLSGRLISNAAQRAFETENSESVDGIAFRAHGYGVANNLFGPYYLNLRNENGVNLNQHMAYPRVGMTEPMRGFAWKRLEDGSLVLNVSGDITGYKAGYLGKQIRFTNTEKTKLGVGFSIRESLGYDPRSGEISNASPYATLFGMQTASLGGAGAVGLQNFFRIGGEPWRKQIIAAARNRIRNGDGIRTLYTGVDRNREGIRNVTGYVSENALASLMTSDNAHNDKEAVMLALAVNGHKTGVQHITLTFRPEEANPDYIKAVLMAIMVGGGGAEIIPSIFSKMYDRYGADMSPYLGDGERIMSFMQVKNAGYFLKGDLQRINQLMGERLPSDSSLTEALNIEKILAINNGAGVSEGGRSTHEARSNFAKYANQVISRSQDVIPDIEKIAAAAVGKDHGYLLPDAERHLAKNGDTTVSIEHLFPNRPELTQFAWDGKETNGVSIVHRGPKSKPTGYFVTYDIQTGVSSNGEPIMSRKVVPVKTLVEAEALRNKYGVSASKAILAQALVSAGAGEASIKEGVMKSDDNIDVSVRANKHLSLSSRQDGTMSMVNDGTYTVGDLDLNLTKAEAVALSATLGSRAVLQAKLPTIEVGRANLMIGDSNARELEGMLRRKLNFGFGQGPIEFVSKMMRVVAYGKKKSGRDKYPDSMTGLEWFKFLKENSVSKDEIRMSGIAYLLHDNADTHLTRKDLAEFIYTVYPRTSRQARTSQVNAAIEVDKVKTGSLSGMFDMPYLDDLQKKEDFVIKTHLDNLEMVAGLIEKALTDEATRADAQTLKDTIMKSIEYTVTEMGAPSGLSGLTDLTMAVNYLRNTYHEGTNKQIRTLEGFAGESRKVRPAILEYVMADSIFGRTSDQYKSIEAALGDLGLINPYSIAYSDVSSSTSPFTGLDLATGRTSNLATSLNEGVGPMKKDYEKGNYTYPSYQGQNFYYHGGNYHSSWASFTGYYQSNPIFSEFYNKRIRAEKDAAIKTLKERIKGTSDAATKAKYESIISNINRVFTVREMIKNGHALHDYGHYSDNDIGTFQIGHVRSTQTILTGEYGFGDPKSPNYHAEESTYGYNYEPEVVVAIEEIQSDSFQYHSFGVPSDVSKALPDSLEQVEGFKRTGDLRALIESRDKLANLVSNVSSLISSQVSKMSYYGRGDVELNALYGVKLLGSLSPVEKYVLRMDLALVDSGRTAEVPEALRQYVGGLVRIPVYEFPDAMSYKDPSFVAKEGYNYETSQRVFNDLFHAAADGVLTQLLPEHVSKAEIRSMFEGTSAGSYSTSSRTVTPSLVFALAALADEEVIAKSIEIHKTERDILPYSGIDWDAVARRTLDRLRKKRLEVIQKAEHQTYSRYAKIKFFDSLMDTYEEWLSSPQNRSAVALISDGGEFREWQYTGDAEYTDLQKHIVTHPEKFRIVSQPNGYSGGLGLRVFAGPQAIAKDLEVHQKNPTNLSGTRTYQIGSPEFEGMLMNHNIQYRVGNTALGSLVANSVQPLISIMSAAADAPERLKQLEKDIADLSKLIPVQPTGRDPAIVNTIPFGVEDVYKPISLNGTVMRAANAGLSAITYADARHQVNRGHSMDTSSAMLVGRQAHIMYLGQDSPKSHLLSYLNMLPDWLTFQLHGGFMDRMAKFSPEEFMTYFRGNMPFDHNGVNARYNVHLLLTLKDAIPHLFTEGVEIGDVPDGVGLREVWRALANNNIESIKDEVGFSDNAFAGDSALLGPDGKPYKPRELSTPFMQRYYGKQVIGEKKSGNQRAIDNGLANIGRYQFWFERGDAMGYVSQYGAPSWFMESIMWGQTKKNQEKFSTDAFIRPNAVLREDGTWTIINSRTGQVIMEKITDVKMLREAMLQNSEYTGSLPYIGQFIKQWGPVGGYVTQGHSNGHVTGNDNIDWSPHFGFGQDGLDPKTQRRRVARLSRSEAKGIVGDTSATSTGITFANAPTKPMSPTGGLSTDLGYKIWFKHVMKVDVNDPRAVSNALTTIATSGGPVLRFKPRFPSEAHKAAFRKKIVEGIALLMPADGGLGKPKADTSTLETLSRMYNWFSKVTKGRKIPTEGEALEDEDESAR